MLLTCQPQRTLALPPLCYASLGAWQLDEILSTQLSAHDAEMWLCALGSEVVQHFCRGQQALAGGMACHRLRLCSSAYLTLSGGKVTHDGRTHGAERAHRGGRTHHGE